MNNAYDVIKTNKHCFDFDFLKCNFFGYGEVTNFHSAL